MTQTIESTREFPFIIGTWRPVLLAIALAWTVASQAGISGRMPTPQAVGVDDPAAEAAKIRVEQQAVYDNLNKNNPLSTSFVNPIGNSGASSGAFPPGGINSGPGTGASTLPGAMPSLPFSTSQFETVNQFLNHPFSKKLVKLGTDPGFKTTLEQVTRSPHRANLMYAEIGWFLFFMVFRAWLAFKLTDSQWFLKLLARLFTVVAFFAGTSILIPVVFMGKPYWELLKHFWGLFT